MHELDSLQDNKLRKTLLAAARHEISRACNLPATPESLSAPLSVSGDFEPINASGVFVSLHLGKRLRGCIGKLRLDQVGPTELGTAAVDAACSDPRFEPVAPGELDGLKIEISLLGPLYPCEPEQVVVGNHGLYLRSDHGSGLLLPQVAVERGWTGEQFLQQLRKKAGLGETPTSTEQLWCFRAVVFDEDANLRQY